MTWMKEMLLGGGGKSGKFLYFEQRIPTIDSTIHLPTGLPTGLSDIALILILIIVIATQGLKVLRTMNILDFPKKFKRSNFQFWTEMSYLIRGIFVVYYIRG